MNDLTEAEFGMSSKQLSAFKDEITLTGWLAEPYHVDVVAWQLFFLLHVHFQTVECDF